MLYYHLQRDAYLAGGIAVRIQVLFLPMESSFIFGASFQFLQFEALLASLTWDAKVYFYNFLIHAAGVMQFLFKFNKDANEEIILIYLHEVVILISELSGVKLAKKQLKTL